MSTDEWTGWPSCLPNSPPRQVELVTRSSPSTHLHCRLCGQTCYDGPLLCDGSRYHTHCYDAVLRDAAKHEAEVEQAQQQILALQQQIAAAQGFWRDIRRAFFGEASPTPALIQQAEPLQAAINVHQERLARLRDQLTPLYDVWPTYPPDWESRRRQAIDDAGEQCTRCGSGRRLHVHHVRAIAQGGSHRLDNLDVLCERCHQNAHGGRSFDKSTHRHQSETSPYHERLQLLERAVRNGECVRFRYRKFNERETETRTIRPSGFKQVGQSYCVVGFCFTRRAERTFAIQRMSHARMVEGQ